MTAHADGKELADGGGLTTFAEPRRPAAIRGPSSGFMVLCAVLFCLVVAIWPSLGPLVQMWRGAEYGYAWLVAPLSCLLFVSRYRTIETDGFRLPYVIFVITGIALLALGKFSNSAWLSIYGAICGCCGLVWSSVGSRGMRRLAGPIGYLLFMIPLPLAAYVTVSAQMQLLSSKLAVLLSSALGVNAILDGNVITLATGKLEVAEACNGLRYLFPLASFGYLLALTLDDRNWKKLTLVFATVPIAILTNAARIAAVAVAVDRYGIGMASGFRHEAEGFFVFLICIGMLLGLSTLLIRIGRRGRLSFDRVLPTRADVMAILQWPTSRPFWIAGGVLAVSAGTLLAFPDRPEVQPNRRPLTLFPLVIGQWKGSPSTLDADTLNTLKLTDYITADYSQSDSDPPVNFYVAYYASQKFGMQAHSPNLCIPGGGWNILSRSVVKLSSPEGSLLPLNRLVIEKDGFRQLVYYWFAERGRNLVDEYQLKYYALRDSLKLRRTDGALVRLSTLTTAADEGAADERLKRFLSSVTPQLPAYVPN